jgi:hypothetical protein
VKGRVKGKVQGYVEGVEYGRKVGQSMSSERRRDFDRYVRGTEYVAAGSPTRAFWLGFRRAMRGQS